MWIFLLSKYLKNIATLPLSNHGYPSANTIITKFAVGIVYCRNVPSSIISAYCLLPVTDLN